MTSQGEITIAGGGLAGLGLGIQLVRAGIKVLLHEARDYPRHRVCGEFISGNGLNLLKQMGLEARLRTLGARDAQTAAFFTTTKSIHDLHLPEPALCISRFQLDAELARVFTKEGGNLKCRSRLKTLHQPGTVRATGRTVSAAATSKTFGVKAHAIGLKLEADLEMHFFKNGYIGLCGVENNKVNVCGLFHSSSPVILKGAGWREQLSGPVGSILQKKLAGANWDESSFSVVGGLDLRTRWYSGNAECRVGDAITMTAPLTGNGMSMAFESAQLAAEPLEKYTKGELNWLECRKQVNALCQSRFRNRLNWAHWIQSLIFSSITPAFFFPVLRRKPRLMNLLFRQTRGR